MRKIYNRCVLLTVILLCFEATSASPPATDSAQYAIGLIDVADQKGNFLKGDYNYSSRNAATDSSWNIVHYEILAADLFDDTHYAGIEGVNFIFQFLPKKNFFVLQIENNTFSILTVFSDNILFAEPIDIMIDLEILNHYPPPNKILTHSSAIFLLNRRDQEPILHTYISPPPPIQIFKVGIPLQGVILEHPQIIQFVFGFTPQPETCLPDIHQIVRPLIPDNTANSLLKKVKSDSLVYTTFLKYLGNNPNPLSSIITEIDTNEWEIRDLQMMNNLFLEYNRKDSINATSQ